MFDLWGSTSVLVTVTCAAVGALAGTAGAVAVLAGRAMHGDVLAHGTVPGVAAAFLWRGRDPVVLLTGAVVGSLIAAVLAERLERHRRMNGDVAAAVTLSLGMSLGLVLLSVVARGGSGGQAGIDRWLFGEVAAVQWTDAALSVVTLLVVAATLLVGRRPLVSATFDPDFSTVSAAPRRMVSVMAVLLLVIPVAVAVPRVGAFMLVALMVAPTVAVRPFTHSFGGCVMGAALVGAVCAAGGAAMAVAADVPPGPGATLVASATAAVSVAVTRRRRPMAVPE